VGKGITESPDGLLPSAAKLREVTVIELTQKSMVAGMVCCRRLCETCSFDEISLPAARAEKKMPFVK
jgi:hypothetical protein